DVKTGSGATLAPRQVAVPEIVKAVAAFFGTRPETLASRTRRRDVLVPRQLAMYLANRYTNASYTEIGRALDRDHPAVANAIKKIERQILENAPVRYQVEALSEKIDALLADGPQD
ncbi:MAG: helix-turn-helix domain-containing protein, partial [Myxococcota bacterium]